MAITLPIKKRFKVLSEGNLHDVCFVRMQSKVSESFVLNKYLLNISGQYPKIRFIKQIFQIARLDILDKQQFVWIQ